MLKCGDVETEKEKRIPSLSQTKPPWFVEEKWRMVERMKTPKEMMVGWCQSPWTTSQYTLATWWQC